MEDLNPNRSVETPEQMFVRIAHAKGQPLLPGTVVVAVEAMIEFHKRECLKEQGND